MVNISLKIYFILIMIFSIPIAYAIPLLKIGIGNISDYNINCSIGYYPNNIMHTFNLTIYDCLEDIQGNGTNQTIIYNSTIYYNITINTTINTTINNTYNYNTTINNTYYVFNETVNNSIKSNYSQYINISNAQILNDTGYCNAGLATKYNITNERNYINDSFGNNTYFIKNSSTLNIVNGSNAEAYLNIMGYNEAYLRFFNEFPYTKVGEIHAGANELFIKTFPIGASQSPLEILIDSHSVMKFTDPLITSWRNIKIDSEKNITFNTAYSNIRGNSSGCTIITGKTSKITLC